VAGSAPLNSADPSGEAVAAPVVVYPGGTSDASSNKDVSDCEPGGTGGAPKLLGHGSIVAEEDGGFIVDVVVARGMVVVTELAESFDSPWEIGRPVHADMATGRATSRTATAKMARCTHVVLVATNSRRSPVVSTFVPGTKWDPDSGAIWRGPRPYLLRVCS
jgi:hypothetical protein